MSDWSGLGINPLVSRADNDVINILPTGYITCIHVNSTDLTILCDNIISFLGAGGLGSILPLLLILGDGGGIGGDNNLLLLLFLFGFFNAGPTSFPVVG